MEWDFDAELKVVNYEEPYERYWARLGRFIHEFSAIERGMQSLLRIVVGVSDPIGGAVFSGVKAHDAMSLVNRACEAKEDEATKAELKPCFDQLGIINGVRNNIVHWGATAAEGEFLVSNRFLAHAEERVREYRVSEQDLLGMTVDLIKIGTHIGLVALRLSGERINDQLYDRMVKQVVEASWLYTPPQQQPPQKPKRANPAKRQRQRDASLS